MLPGYILIIDIVDLNPNNTEEQFRSDVAFVLNCLDALKGAFDRSPSTKNFYQYTSENEEYENGCWSVRGMVLISLGKERAKYLIELYKSVSDLIMRALPPNFEVKCYIEKFQSS